MSAHDETDDFAVFDVEDAPRASSPDGAASEVQRLFGNEPDRAGVPETHVRAVARLVRVDDGGVRAVVLVPAGVGIPAPVLEQVLHEHGIIQGVQREAVLQAGAATPNRRELVVAVGVPPSVSAAGVDVHGQPLAVVPARPELEITNDGMEAAIAGLPGHQLDRRYLKQLIDDRSLQRGFDRAALDALLSRPLPGCGRVVLARGQQPRPRRPAGFYLDGSRHNQAALAHVAAGDRLAVWQAGDPGRDGWDVFGRRRSAPGQQVREPADYVGVGCELQGGGAQALSLIARVDGVCYQRTDGQIHVVHAYEHDGDLTAVDGALATNEVVVVHGDVADGCKVTTTSDLVVQGDVHNAAICAGGEVQVLGAITPGSQSIEAAGAIVCEHARERRITAGAVTIHHLADNCEVVASGDVSVGRAVGGRLTAGGSLILGNAGDADGTVTELWAGGDCDPAVVRRLHKLQVAGRVRARHAAMGELQRVQGRLGNMAHVMKRHRDAAWRDEQAVAELRDQAKHLRRQADGLADECDRLRDEIRERHHQRHALLAELVDHEDIVVHVHGAARHGVGTRLSDLGTQRIEHTQWALRRSLNQELAEHERGSGARRGVEPGSPSTPSAAEDDIGPLA